MAAQEIPVEGAAPAAPEGEEQVEASVEEQAAQEPQEAQTDSAEGEPAVEATGATEADDEAAQADEPEPDEGAELEAAKKEAAELKDRYARLQAEWDNFRKRTASERESERARAAESLVTDLLPALDDIERAINHARESGDGSSLVEGVEAIQSKFLQILAKHKVEQVEALGSAFDAMKHQAVGTAEDASVPEETVLQVYQQGYKMGDRVIRPAMVVTSTGGPARDSEPTEG